MRCMNLVNHVLEIINITNYVNLARRRRVTVPLKSIQYLPMTTIFKKSLPSKKPWSRTKPTSSSN